MSGTQRFFANDRNLIATATLTASSVKQVSGTVSETSRVADGYGTISLSGAYTGANNATFDILITAGGTAKHVSTAEYIGSGNGTISSITATGLDAQTISVECVSTGVAGQVAQIHLGDVRLQSIAAGASGNGISVTITPSLTIGAKIGAIPKQINPGETGWSGDEWNFGQLPIQDDGNIPEQSLRVAINQDLAHIYRLYKTWDGQNWRYNMTPPAAQEYSAGSSVHVITGTYAALVEQESQTDEVYSGYSTLYSLLNAILASNLLTIDGAVVNDKRPGGMGIIDVPWRTSATAIVSSSSGSEYVQLLNDILITAASVTQTATIKCTNNSVVGQEEWSVVASVSGNLGTAVTGTQFDNVLSFLIPEVVPEITGTEIQVVSKTYVTREPGQIKPDLCLKGAVLGRKSVPKRIKWVYSLREQEPCECRNVFYTGVANAELLGIPEVDEMAAEPADLKSRRDEIYAVYKQIVDQSTYRTGTTSYWAGKFIELTRGGEYQLKGLDSVEVEDVVTYYQDDGWKPMVFHTTYTVPGSPPTTPFYVPAPWVKLTAKTLGAELVIYLSGDWYRFVCTTAGTTGATQPTWTTVVGATFTDGSTLIWTGYGKALDANMPEFKRSYQVAWSANTGVGKYSNMPRVSTGSTYANFICIQGGITGNTQPDWLVALKSGEQIMDGDVIWRSIGTSIKPAWTSNSNPQFALQLLGIASNCLADIYADATALAEWDLLWQEMQRIEVQDLLHPDVSESLSFSASYLEKYNAWSYTIKRLAGLNPGKFDAGLTGNAVWQDQQSSYWWVAEDESYLPLFTNVFYHSSIYNADGDPTSTMEFGLAITCGCPDELQAGDSITIDIGNQNKTYLPGDVFNIAITGGNALVTAGGITAIDTITWRVGPGFADYALTSGEPAYSNAGLAFQINRGGIPFVPGDKFYFDVENSLQFKWRKDAGAWSANTAIGSTVSLSSGLSATFTPGVAPSWIVGDAWSFSVLQPYSPAYVQAPLPLDFGWQWSTAGETLSIDLGTTQTITACGILAHSLPAGATLALWGGSTTGATDWNEALTWRAGPILALFSAHSSRYLRLVIGSATGGSIGWLWVGQPLTVSKPGGVTRRRYEHRMVRDGGINPGARRVGKGWGATVEWNESTGWITQTDVDALLSMIENCKANNDYPIVFLPTYLDTTEGMLVRIAKDEIEIIEQSGHQPLGANRRINMSLEMAPVLL